MTIPQWAWELARTVRTLAGVPSHLPLDLPATLPWVFDLTVEEVPGLTVALASRRLVLAGCLAMEVVDRPLRACLVARRGVGWIFLDANDPPEEKTFSLAHETAHFLRHHWQPRQRAADLGPDALETFDSGRPIDPRVRLKALLHGVPLRPFTHLMHRDPGHLPPEVRTAEEEADLLAIELLAPEEELRRQATDRASAEACLQERFGLPASVARSHAARLFPRPSGWILLTSLKKVVSSVELLD